MKEFVSSSVKFIRENGWQLLVLVASLLFFFVVLGSAGYQIYDIYNLSHHKINPTLAPTPLVSQGDLRNSNLPINHWHLFGSNKKLGTNALNVKWTLRGIIAANNNANLAIIASNDSDEAVYKVGDVLPDGSIISNILFDRVLLTVNGTKENLLLWLNNEKITPDEPEVIEKENGGGE